MEEIINIELDIGDSKFKKRIIELVMKINTIYSMSEYRAKLCLDCVDMVLRDFGGIENVIRDRKN